MGATSSAALKPVPQMITSHGCSTPSALTTPSGRTALTACVTNCTLGRCKVGCQVLEISSRLQPGLKLGVSAARRVAWGTCALRWRPAMLRSRFCTQAEPMKPMPTSSLNQYTRQRLRRCTPGTR